MAIYSIAGFEEPFSSFSHLFAAPVFLAWGMLLLARYGRGGARFTSLLVLVVSTVFLLSMSGVYHLLGQGGARAVLKQLDIAGVFALIAGTATPVHAVMFTGVLRWMPLLVAWLVAAAGIALRTVFSDSLPIAAGTSLFLLMGWGGLFTVVVLWRRFGFQAVELLLAGGVAYSVGAVVLIVHGPTIVPGVIGPHELWHVAVLAGLTLHWMFIESCMRLSMTFDEAASARIPVADHLEPVDSQVE